MPEMYTSFAEHLASHGFIVVSVYHTDGTCAALVTDNGRVKFNDRIREFGINPKDKVDRNNPVQQELQSKYRAHQLRIRVQDISDCLTVLKLYADPTRKAKYVPDEYQQFKRRIDINRLVCFGHSFGGCTTVAALTITNKHGEPYFKLGISLDGWLEPLACSEDLSQLETDQIHSANKDSFVYRISRMKKFPVLAFINSELWQWEQNIATMEIIGKYLMRHVKLQYMWTIPQTGHHNYNDLGLLAPKLGKKLKLLQSDIDHVHHITVLCDILYKFITTHLDEKGDRSYFSNYLLQGNTSSSDS
jgi:hypothetical protein